MNFFMELISLQDFQKKTNTLNVLECLPKGKYNI